MNINDIYKWYSFKKWAFFFIGLFIGKTLGIFTLGESKNFATNILAMLGGILGIMISGELDKQITEDKRIRTLEQNRIQIESVPTKSKNFTRIKRCTLCKTEVLPTISRCPNCESDKIAYERVELSDTDSSKITDGNLKKCPFCAEDIQNAAIKCKHCGEFLN